MKKNKLTALLKYCNAISMVLSLVLSWYAIYSANKLAIYQVEQERMPSVVCLNQDVKVNFKIDYYDKINGYGSIDDLKVKVYNLGSGIAKNCELTWDMESIKNACVYLKESLCGSVDIHEFESKDFANQSFALYDYMYEFKDGDFQSIWYYDHELDDYIEHKFDIAPTYIPYIMPITTKETSAYIEVPPPLAVILLEMGNQEFRESVDIKLNINYQDMTGKKYDENLNINIRGDGIQKSVLDKESYELREKNYAYAISAEKITK